MERDATWDEARAFARAYHGLVRRVRERQVAVGQGHLELGALLAGLSPAALVLATSRFAVDADLLGLWMVAGAHPAPAGAPVAAGADSHGRPNPAGSP